LVLFEQGWAPQMV